MTRRLLYFLAALAIFAGILATVAVVTTRPAFIRYDGVAGPQARTALPEPPPPTPWRRYSGGGPGRLAVLLTDPDSAWLGLAHGLKSAGIPFTITGDYEAALRHRAILVYPTVSGSVLPQEALRALARVPRDGGTLIGSLVLGGGLGAVFGFEDAVASRQRRQLTIAAADDPREVRLPLGGDRIAVGTYAYTNPTATALASYEDGAAAILRREVGAGRAYTFGIDLGELLLKGQNWRLQGIARSYVNDYEPTLDVLLRLLADIYREAEPGAAILRPVPHGRDLAVVISHDVDYTRSLANALDYGRLAQQHGIAATFFIQTKYLRDWNDDIIVDEDGPGRLAALRDMGMELASHGVSHSLRFADFPLGDGGERYPDYRPFVEDAETTAGGSILGELRVSRFLIERLAGAPPVESFRPGYLSNPVALPQALAATGYAYSSSVTANASLTHLPFQLKYDRGPASELPVFEFPVTIEDEKPPPLGERLPEAVALARRIARRGGLCMVLIHPDIRGHKLAFEDRFIAAVKPFSWFGTLADYGRWWAARNAVELDPAWQDGRLVLRLTAPQPRDGLPPEGADGRLVLRLTAPQPLDGLTLEVPAGLRLDPARPQPPGAELRGDRLLLGRLAGAATVTLVPR